MKEISQFHDYFLVLRTTLYIILRFSFVISICIILIGCSTKPSDSEAQKLIEHFIQEESNGLIKLVNLTKTGEGKGVNFYVLNYEAEIEFIDDCYWERGLAGEQTFKSRKEMLGFLLKESVKKGQRKRMTGTLHFEKTERGWRVQYGQFYTIRGKLVK